MKGRDAGLGAAETLARSATLPGDTSMAALLAEVADVIARETNLRREVESLRAELQRARAGEEDARQMKATFVAHMSHEIRTPLNAIVGLVEQMLAGTLSDEQRELAQHVRASGEQMAQVLGGILDFVAIETDGLALMHQPFALVAEIERALEAVAPFAAANNVELCMTASESAYVTAVGDAGRLRQLVFHLVGNAVKFAGSGDVEVKVEVERAGDEEVVASVVVRDHGRGFAPQVLPALFTGPSSSVGLGIGMKLCARVCSLMRGEITAENAEDGGARVRFSVRLGLVETPAHAVVDLKGRRVQVALRSAALREVMVGWLARWNAKVVEEGGELVIADVDLPVCTAAGGVPVVAVVPVGSDVVPRAPVVARVVRPVMHDRLAAAVRSVAAPVAAAPVVVAPVQAAMGKLRILVAEDNPFNQRVIVGALKRLGHAADVVMDGRAAVEAVERKVYDLVLMDVMMPELDGVAATREICGRWPAEARPRIVAITAQATADDHAACLAAGMADFLTKPLETARLALVVESCPVRAD